MEITLKQHLSKIATEQQRKLKKKLGPQKYSERMSKLRRKGLKRKNSPLQ